MDVRNTMIVHLCCFVVLGYWEQERCVTHTTQESVVLRQFIIRYKYEHVLGKLILHNKLRT